MAGDFRVGLLPADVFPMIGAGAADLRFEQTAVIEDVLHEGRSFGTERAAVDGMVGIAFHVDHLRGDVFRLVPDGVDDDATAHRAVGAGGAGFGGPGNFQFFGFGVGGFQVKAENRSDGGSGADLQETSACWVHVDPPKQI